MSYFSIGSETFNGTTVAVNSSESKTHFAADGLAGFDVAVAPGFSLGGRYQYLWINSAESSDVGAGVTEKDGNFRSHVLTAQAVFKF
jgi:opacity protein-like surface antigen